MKTVAYHTLSFKTITGKEDMVIPLPKTLDWIRNEIGDVHLIEETLLPQYEQFNGKIKIAILIETPAVYNYCKLTNPNLFDPFDWIQKNHQHFSFIMSPYKFLKDLVGEDKYLFIPVGGSRIERDSFGMYEKERLLSIVASRKNWTQGHRLRHEIIDKFRPKMDVYGSGYNDIIDNFNGNMGKIIALAPYYFTLAIINSTYDDFFTEVITDALAVGTIPIWWGTDKIGNYFNPEGIIQFKTVADFENILPTLTPELYQSKRNAVMENIELAKKYITHFDWIYENYKERLENL